MSQIFISHSSKNNPAALALRDWLKDSGWGEDRIFLDIDPEAGISPGERWEKALQDAADRCEAVVFLVSPEWIASQWCLDEFRLTRHLKKKILGVVIAAVPFEKIPAEMTREWQLCDLTEAGEKKRFAPSYKGKTHKIEFSSTGLARLKIGLEKAGLAATTFAFKTGRSPYPGLKPLEEDDAAIFFGRDAEIIRALDELRGLREAGNKQLFVIQGASGTGKSSFLRAGLMARLRRDDRNFLVLPPVRPETAALTGDNGLAASLATAASSLGLKLARGDIKADEKSFAKTLEDLRAAVQKRNVGSASAPAIILPIDQAEELFNPGAEIEARAFLTLLNALKQFRGGALALATIRSDRYEALQSAQEISGLTQHPFNLPPIPPAFFAQIIEGPAQRRTAAGAKLEIAPELTAKMLEDIKGEGEAMPLIAFTMHQLFKNYGEDGKLDAGEYAALGGIKGSIERAIAEACRDPGNPPAIPADAAAHERGLRRTFIPHLVRLDGAAATALRQIVVESALPAEAQAYTKRLVGQSVLTRNVRAGATTVEIAHESVLRLWDRLKTWLADEADNLKIRDTIKSAAAEWQAKGRAADFLTHTGSRLADAERLARDEDYRADLGELGEAYVRACRANEDAEREMERQRLARIARWQRVAGVFLGIAALILSAGVLFVTLQAGQFLDTRAKVIAEAANRRGDDGRFDSSLRLALLSGDVSRKSKFETTTKFAESNLLTFANNETQKMFAIVPLIRSLWASRIGPRLRGHESSVASAAFSPNGKLVITTSEDKTARLWDVATGKEIAVLRGHEGPVTSAVFSPDGTRVVTASEDNTARLWDSATGKEIAVLRGHEGPVVSAAFSPDGTRVVTASEDNTARLWDGATAKEFGVLRGHESWVTTAAFSPDGARVVTASIDYTARLWDGATGQEIAVLRGHQGQVASAAFSPDGARVVTASGDTTARLWDGATGKEIAVLRGHESRVTSASFSPDGLRVVTASYDKTARLWDGAAGQELAVLRGHEGLVFSAAFSSDGTWVVTASNDTTARLWDGTTGQDIAVLRGHQAPVFSASFSPDGARIVTASGDKTARLWNGATGPEITVLRGHGGRVASAAFSPDGARVVTASEDGTARLWSDATANEIAVLRGHENQVVSAAFSPDGARVVTASYDKTARIWDGATGQEIAVLRGHENWVVSAAFSPDGRRVVTASWDKTARLWDGATGKEIAVLRGHEGPVVSAAFSPDGKRVVTASSDNTARLWDGAKGKEIAALSGHEDKVNSAAFSPDGARVVTASADKTARLWDGATGMEIAVLRGHEGPVDSVAFSPDGARVVTASGDKTARLWDSTTGKELAVLRGHGDAVNSVDFSSDGARVVTASGDKTARVWDVSLVTLSSYDDLASLACVFLGPAMPADEELLLVGMENEDVGDLCAPYGAGP